MILQAGERGQPLLQRPGSLRVRTHTDADNDHTTANAGTVSVRACAPAPREQLPGQPRLVDFPDELRRRLRRQDALVGAIALLLLAVAAVALTYVYWDGGRQFESTDDAFIAGRQFPTVSRAVLAPSGYSTAKHLVAPTTKARLGCVPV
jgi:membrane fusion protein, multidrug efflux system